MIRPRISASIVLLLALTILLVFSGVHSEEPANVCMDEATRERIRRLALEGLDIALEGRVQQLFDSWMKDATDQPHRASLGLHKAVAAYVGSRSMVAKWNPSLCP